jgi:hypothetical protein
MIGNVALDAVIGLVFIYLLYSLYATVMMEIISSFLGLRARNLCYALSRMLMDERKIANPILNFGSRLATTAIRITGKSTNMKNPELYRKFFEQPSIKYLGSGGVGNTPSYLSAENFSKAIIDTLKTDDIDMSLLARIEQGILSDLPFDSETKKQILSLLDEANNDLVKFKILLEQWFNDTMERATGWFKQSTQMILVVIGLVLSVSFNVDTLAIIKKLSKDEDARNQLVAMATDFSNKNAGMIAAIENSPADKSDEKLKARLDSLRAIRTILDGDIRNAQNMLASDWNIADSVKIGDSTRSDLHPDSIQVQHILNKKTVYFVVHKSIDPETFKSAVSADLGNGFVKINTLCYKVGYVFNLDRIWGYLLTILALSLGAPFWFDLLNKLVKLRTSSAISSGSESKPGLSSSPVANRNILNRAG